MNQDTINDKFSFTGNGINAKEDKGVVKLEPSRANGQIFLLREGGPFAMVTTNDKLIINYGGEYLLEVESSEYKGHVLSMLDEQQHQIHKIEANQCEDGVEQDFIGGKISFEDEGRKLVFSRKDREVDLEISLQVEGFDEKRKLKYAEMDGNDTFNIEMKSRSEMNLEEINKVEQEFLEVNRSGVRSASMGIGRSAVAGAITRSFGVFRENGLQVIRNGTPVIELKAQ